jgi:excisionase family DNA binding protein
VSAPTETAPAPSRLVDLPTAAAELGVTTRTARRWIDCGRLAGYRVGVRSVRVDRDDLVALKAALETPRRIASTEGGAR